MKRAFDIAGSAIALLLLAVPMLAVALLVRLSSPGPTLHWSRRVGRGNRLFLMPKFRTMLIEAPQLATHLMTNPEDWLTPIGRWLRRTSFDEVPQLWSVLIGDMSLVGPRPALFNQRDLIRMRTNKGVHRLVPGLTGLAQIRGRDDLSIADKVQYDADYGARMSLLLDLRIIVQTVVSSVKGDGVRH